MGVSRQEYWSGLPHLPQIFQTQGSNQCLLHCKRILHSLSHPGSPTPFYHLWNHFHQGYQCLCPWGQTEFPILLSSHLMEPFCSLWDSAGFQVTTLSGFPTSWRFLSGPCVVPDFLQGTHHHARNLRVAGCLPPSPGPGRVGLSVLSPSSRSPWTAASPQHFHYCCEPTPSGNSFLIDLPPPIFSSSLIHLPHF